MGRSRPRLAGRNETARGLGVGVVCSKESFLIGQQQPVETACLTPLTALIGIDRNVLADRKNIGVVGTHDPFPVGKQVSE